MEITIGVEERGLTVERSALAEPWIRFTPRLIVAAALGVAAVVLWVRLLSGMADVVAPPIDPVYEQASLRFAVAITSERINSFARVYGRTPAILGEVGEQPFERIAYERISNERYRLTASGSTGPITYDSLMPLDNFLGRSREMLGVTMRGHL